MDYKDIESLLKNPKPTKLLALMKIGWREHLEFIKKGNLRFRKPEFYAATDGQQAIFFDRNEGLESILQSDRINITITAPDGTSHTLSRETGLVDEVLVKVDDNCVILCMHAMHTGHWHDKQIEDIEEYRKYLQIPEKMNEFGDSVWVITKPKEFTDRLVKKINELDLSLTGTFVRYIKFQDYHGRIPSEFRHFIKHEDYSEEREYRYRISSPLQLEDPYILNLGDLSDVSAIMSLEEFKSSWKLDFET